MLKNDVRNPKGAGRKSLPDKLKKVPYGTRLRYDLVQWLKSRKNASMEIEIALEKHIKRSEL